jgi:hypothetical protein
MRPYVPDGDDLVDRDAGQPGRDAIQPRMPQKVHQIDGKAAGDEGGRHVVVHQQVDRNEQRGELAKGYI